MNLQILLQNDYFILVIAVWELVWKGFALWKSAKNGHRVWFVALLLINSVGLLPIIYLAIDYYKNKDLKKITVFKRIKKLFRKK
jgi:hypothetical protein